MEIQSSSEMGPGPAGPGAIATLSRARRALLELLNEQHGPVTLADLVALSGLHENTVRGHLEGLAAEGLVTSEHQPPQGRGRPALLWRARSDHSEYAGLASALAYTLRDSSAHPEDDAVEAGRRWGHSLAADRVSRAGATAVSAVRDLLDGLGFVPEGAVAPTADAARLRLTRCPLLEVAKEVPSVVCNVHLGLVVGALERYGASDPDAELVPFAEPGACALRISDGTT